MLVRRRGTVAELHALDPFSGRRVTSPEVWWCDPIDATVVLGSRQRPDLLDLDACARAGLSVARRRSGGGLVLVRPGSIAWVDVIVPADFLPDDVRGSMVWMGERWAEVLADLGVEDARVHRGGMMGSPWSDLVCFAGIGPGEVLVDDAKLVGLSQRRTRDGRRIQGLVHTAPPVLDLRDLFVGAVPDEPVPAPATRSLVPELVASRLADVLATAPG